MDKFYRGYILVRLAKIGAEYDITEKMMKLKDPKGSWFVTFCSPIYGAWDIVIETSFKKLEDLDFIVTTLRSSEDIRDSIEETTTLVSSKPNYPPEK